MIFSNTTPFIALSAIDRLDLLPQLFDRIHVAPHVVQECAVGGGIFVPSLQSLSWVSIANIDEATDPNPLLTALDIGEKWTLHAASNARAKRVLIDERIARNVAERMGLPVTGTLGILLAAHERRLIESFSAAAGAMREQGIFYNAALIKRLAALVGE